MIRVELTYPPGHTRKSGSEKTLPRISLRRKAISPAVTETAPSERRRFDELKETANFRFLSKNCDHTVSVKQTAIEIIETQKRENLSLDVVVLQEIPVTSLKEGESDMHAQEIARELGMELAAFTPYYRLAGKRVLSRKERQKVVMGGIGIFTRHPVVEKNEIVYPLLLNDDSTDEVGGTRRRMDFYNQSYGIPMFITAQIKFPGRDKPITVATAHFPPALERNAHQLAVAENFTTYMKKLGVDIAGVDTNAAPDTKVMEIILKDNKRGDDNTNEPTYFGEFGPAKLDPLRTEVTVRKRVDYVLLGNTSQITDAAGITVAKGSADHKGLIVVGII